MLSSSNSAAWEKAMKLAVVAGLRTMMGPAFLAASQNRPERQTLAAAALGEMVLDKLPFMPSRSALPLLLPRAAAGAWVAKNSLEGDGIDEPWAMPMGAIVAAGVATLAPSVRFLLRRTLGVPDMFIGLAEDYLALRLGSEATGMTMQHVREIAEESVSDVKDRLLPAGV